MPNQVQTAGTRWSIYQSYNSPLYNLLVEKLPPYVVGGRLSVNRVATACGITRQALYRYLLRNQITDFGIDALVRGMNGLLHETDFSQFLVANVTDK